MSLAVAANPARASHSPALRPDPRLGLVDREQAEHEARAKAMWGDSREQIISYLMIQGFSLQETSDLAQSLFQERIAAVRSNGIRKIFIGIGLICVPIIGHESHSDKTFRRNANDRALRRMAGYQWNFDGRGSEIGEGRRGRPIALRQAISCAGVLS